MSPLHHFSILLVVSVVGVCGQSACTISCEGLDPGVKIPDPMNCRRYYVCLDDGAPSDVAFDCAEGEKFNSMTNGCVDETTDPECAFCDTKCKFMCKEDSNPYFAADPFGDCTIYFLCGMGPGQLLRCPQGKYFNGTDCQDDPNRCCNPCLPVCHTAFTQIANPYDCTTFFYCEEADYYPEEKDLYQCPAGEIFDSNAGHCDANAACTQPCPLP